MAVWRQGHRRRGRWCEIVSAPSAEIGGRDEQTTRFGISVTRQAGKAVRRNRIKRIIREFLRHHKELWPINQTAVIRVKSPVDDEAGFLAELEDMLKNL